jgi:hypothetical protein
VLAGMLVKSAFSLRAPVRKEAAPASTEGEKKTDA